MKLLVATISLILFSAPLAGQEVREAHLRQSIGRFGDTVEFEAVHEAVQLGDTLYVAEPSRISVFARGRLVGRIGGAGQGPGEYQRIVDMGLLGDTLWVADGMLRRVTLLSRDGTLLETIPVRAENLARSAFRLSHGVPRHDGSLVAVGAYWADAIAAGVAHRTPILRVTREGNVLDTITSLDVRATDVGVVQRGEDLGTYLFIQPIRDEPLWDVRTDLDALAVVDRRITRDGAGLATLTRYDLDGVLRWTRTFRGSAVTVPRSFAPEWIEKAFELSVTRQAVSRRDLRAAMFLPPFFPPVGALALCGDGWTWISFGGWQQDAPVTWMTFDPQGAPVARLTLPYGRRVLDCTESSAWIRAHGEYGEAYVELWEVR